MDQLITILGPTAVGKTELTLLLADFMKSPVISGDAYQVYKQLNIGTAKPSKEELNQVKHYLIDTLEPEASYSAADFQKEAKAIIQVCNQQHKIPILSGGTGFYVQALLENYNFSDLKPNDDLRVKLNQLVEKSGINALRLYAQKMAGAHGITLPFQDKHRLYRAIEMMEAGQISSLLHQTKDGLSYDGPVIGLMRDRERLYERINLRVDSMVEKGLFEEVESLLEQGVSSECQAFKGIGYKEVLQFLLGHITKDTCIDLIKKNTRNFAKRQITWYKRMPYIQWIYIEDGMTGQDIYQIAKDLL